MALTSNSAIIEKTALAVADMTDAGGYLSPEQSSRFIRGVIDQPTIISKARTVLIDGENKKIEKLGFGQRIMRPGVENTALLPNAYAKPTFGKVTLSTKETIAEIRLSYDTLEANIERRQLKDTIIQMIQSRVALDLEELIIQGDTDATDPYLAILDGLLKKSADHVIDARGVEVDLDNWTALIKSVPQKYIRDVLAWRMYTSRNVDLSWKKSIAGRNTVAGDRFLLQNVNATALGFEIEPVAMMPENLTFTPTVGQPVANLGQALLIHPQNIIVGFTRRIQIEQDKDISARQHIIVVTLKVDMCIEETDAVGKLINLKP